MLAGCAQKTEDLLLGGWDCLHKPKDAMSDARFEFHFAGGGDLTGKGVIAHLEQNLTTTRFAIAFKGRWKLEGSELDMDVPETEITEAKVAGEPVSDADRDEMSKSLKAAAGTSHIAKLTNTEMTLEEPSSVIACKRLPG